MKEAQYEGADAVRKDHVLVAVRFRPMSDREYQRGDREVWECEGQAVGIADQDTGMQVKFMYDHVFGGAASNADVYGAVASPIVASALDGINGTIFAYGVTSSGKTHTMMGSGAAPGMVPQAIAQVFATVARAGARTEFTLRLSMMEIYNEVLNDLLDPARSNLKLREDPRRGVGVEGITEENLVSAEHAIQVIARGNENRKTAATAFNEGSSRSHTIIRLSIEARDRPGANADPSFRGRRTFSLLNLIDLAGSESAKAEIHSKQRMEGSFINKSLLTLGTVIHKLAEGNAAHIPYRDSKLTRLLQSSLTGSGARVAVVCTVTPASTQAEETHNTLKFASRAKKIAIAAKRNEIMDQSTLISRYQEEITTLRSQLDIVMREQLAQRENLLASVRNLGTVRGTTSIMLAEREFLQAQLSASDEHSDKLARALERMRLQLAESRGVDPDAIGYGLDEDVAGESAAVVSAARTLRHGYDHVLAEKVLAMESKVGAAIDALRAKEEQIGSQRAVLASLAGLEDQIQGQLSEVTAENTTLRGENACLRRELDRLEAQNNHVQGYYLDDLSHAELSELIGTLTQAVERVRITVQLRRLARGKRGSNVSLLGGETPSTGMSREAMRAALQELQLHSPSTSDKLTNGHAPDVPTEA
ncbi:Kinesin-related protein 11 [Auxenochlorella protothecoides]|uniref:Kinesin-related protein 11 n=1 Tax=Auxenochlorella protothecoides TaxID=3075 RepID=A0A087SM46_AUXPR|nr:Kinesin-related protein 11 [Auxenochlorella protothecoides]KFM26800.1 Kinesin-related protein 11 [Auxenochlorella protothecoides]